MRERERKRKEELERFETECLDKIAEKLRIADDYILEMSFSGKVGGAEMQTYTESKNFLMFKKAVERRRWLEWLWCLITEDSSAVLDEELCAVYGTDKVAVLRKIYKGEIAI